MAGRRKLDLDGAQMRKTKKGPFGLDPQTRSDLPQHSQPYGCNPHLGPIFSAFLFLSSGINIWLERSLVWRPIKCSPLKMVSPSPTHEPTASICAVAKTHPNFPCGSSKLAWNGKGLMRKGAGRAKRYASFFCRYLMQLPNHPQSDHRPENHASVCSKSRDAR